MTTTATDQTPDLAAIEADARAQLAELEQDEARLALGAFSDPAVAEEYASVRSRRDAAKETVNQAEKAREDQARREVEAAEHAEADRRVKALARSERLQKQIAVDERAVDDAADVLAKAVRTLSDHCASNEAELVTAGLAGPSNTIPSARANRNRITGTIAFAHREHGVRRLVDFAGNVYGQDEKPLSVK